MKFSEEVVLGSTLIRFTANYYLSANCGCLIGMAGASQGETCFDQFVISDQGILHWVDGIARMIEVFPWLELGQDVGDVRGHIHPTPRMAINRSADAIRDQMATFEQALTWLQTTIDPIQEEWDRTHAKPEPAPIQETELVCSRE